MSLVHNEQWKLTATWLNTVASAVVVVGAVTPVVAIAYGFSVTRADTWLFSGLAVICVLAGMSLHLVARRVLRRLRP